ncbi:MAG: fimbrillin family protein [Prevotellaceae bacterium]|nr:fimbrillin family protein [Candidatus Colivivens caballi]
MKKTRILSFMASAVAVVALLAGCSTENDFENGKDGLASLELSSVSSSDMLTRAVIDGEEFPTDKGNIGLFLYADADASEKYGDGYANVQYSYNSTKSKWTASPSIKVGSTPGYLYGYYPYNAANTDIKAIPVTSSVNGDDVMYASKQEHPITDLTAANTSIKMNHALARVAIKVINNGYTGEAKLSNIKFEGATIASSGRLNATDGSITASKADDVALSVLAAEQTIATGDGSTYECLLVPSEVSSNRQTVTLSLTIDSKDKTLTLSGNNGVIFKPGVKSTVTITLSNTGIALKSVSINDWQTVEVGEVKVGGHKVTIQTADGIDPNDILAKAYVDGNSVVIRASSFQGAKLVCNVGDNAKCERTITNDKFTFTISEISSDIEAVLGYATIVTLTVTSNSNGKVWIGEDKGMTSGQFEAGQQVVIHAAPNNEFIFLGWNDNNKETDRTITVGMTDDAYFANFIPTGALPSLFTVDSNGKQVCFSKGNLQFHTTEKIWQFAENQYDIIDTSLIFDYAENSNKWIELFGWGTSGYNHGATCYQPWSRNENGYPEPEKYYAYGYQDKNLYDGGKNLYDDSGKADWGYNPISNGGNIENLGWRTLSQSQWDYLFNGRTDASLKWGLATVEGVHGMILLPDEFTDPKTNQSTYCTDGSFVSGNPNKNWNTNSYSGTNWQAMQNAGAVLLPCAGERTAAGSINPGSGCYWSSSTYVPQGTSSSQQNMSCNISFWDLRVQTGETSRQYKDYGNSVRLVIDVK